jgi:hypothetical protein
MKETLIRIQAPHFVAGVILVDNKVKRYAPIVKYMHGWTKGQVLSYVSMKGWAAHEDKSTRRNS